MGMYSEIIFTQRNRGNRDLLTTLFSLCFPLFAQVFGGFVIRRILYFLFSDCKSLYSLCGGLQIRRTPGTTGENISVYFVVSVASVIYDKCCFCSPGCRWIIIRPCVRRISESAACSIHALFGLQILILIMRRIRNSAEQPAQWGLIRKSAEHPAQRGIRMYC